MATQPKPKPKPEPEPPEPEPEPNPDVNDEGDGQTGISMLERVENLENRMTALEERVAAPPVGLGKRP
jgi:hypothetical protein